MVGAQDGLPTKDGMPYLKQLISHASYKLQKNHHELTPLEVAVDDETRIILQES